MKIVLVIMCLFINSLSSEAQILEKYDSMLNFLATHSKVEYRFQKMNKLKVVQVDTTQRIVPDDNPNDDFNNSFEVTEIWHLLSLKEMTFDRSLIVNMDSVELCLPLESFYTLNKEKIISDRKANKLLHRFIREKLANSDSLFFSDIERFAEEHDFRYGLYDIIYDIQKQLLLGRVIVKNHEGLVQNQLVVSLYITPFSQGMNFHINNKPKTRFLHVNHLMR